MDPALIALCLVFSIIGCAIGTFTGLIPGIHVNTLAAVMLAVYGWIETILSGIVPEDYIPVCVCSIIMASSVVHSFLDFVPAVFIGAPDGEDAISILPGHRLLLKGEGMKAVRSAAIGSLIGCSAAILLAIPVQYIMLSGVSDYLNGFTKYVLLAVSAIIVLNEQRKGNLMPAVIAFLLSGGLGYMVMELPIPSTGILGEGTLLMPMLTGLFGLPMMLTASKGKPYPKQTDSVKDPVGVVPGLKGVFMGTVAGWFPGITSTVGATISATIMPERSPERFISTVASIGTVTTVLSLVTLSVSGGGRSGTVIVIGEILGDSISGFATTPFIILIIIAAFASLIGYGLTVAIGNYISKRMAGQDPWKLNKAIIGILIILVFLTTGFWGMVILVIALTIGFIPVKFETAMIPLCGCLIVPVLLM